MSGSVNAVGSHHSSCAQSDDLDARGGVFRMGHLALPMVYVNQMVTKASATEDPDPVVGLQRYKHVAAHLRCIAFSVLRCRAPRSCISDGMLAS